MRGHSRARSDTVLSRVEQDGGRVLKGQLVFEFIVATLFFLAIIMYTINYLNSTVFLYSSDHHINILESKAWQISEVLVRSQGDWSGSPPLALGLANEWPELDEDKISDLETLCQSSMNDVIRLLNVDSQMHWIALEVNKSLGSGGETNLLECGSLPSGIQNARVTRFGISDMDQKLLKVTVWYW